MRFLVFSDSHGNTKNILTAINIHKNADALIFLGDGANEFRTIAERSGKPFYIVRGNCDFGSNEKNIDFISLKEHKIMICHGHLYNVKQGIQDLLTAAKKQGCNIVLFGHTHIPFSKYIDEIHLMNPGTVAISPVPTYGILDITDNGVLSHTANLY